MPTSPFSPGEFRAALERLRNGKHDPAYDAFCIAEQVEANRVAIMAICDALISCGDLHGSIIRDSLRKTAQAAKDGSASDEPTDCPAAE